MLSSFTIFQSSVGDLYIKTPKLIEYRLRFFSFVTRKNFQLLFRIISFVVVVTKNIFSKGVDPGKLSLRVRSRTYQGMA